MAMQIQSGKLYENRTWKYLYPCLKHYGTDLTNQLSQFFKIAVGIGDSNIEHEGNCIFILVNTSMPLGTLLERENYVRNFSKFIDWIKYQDYYVTDYVYNNLEKSDKHMIVLKLPSIHDVSYVDFIRGHYSKMYTKKQFETYFNILPNPGNAEGTRVRNAKVGEVRLILSRDKVALRNFVDRVNKDFGTEVTMQDFADAELDYPIQLSEEIFNYKGA